MNQPRTYAELRQHWLQRVMPAADLPHMRAATTRQVLQATIAQLQCALRDSDRDPQAGLASAVAFSAVPTNASQEEVSALIDVARTARAVRGPGSQRIEEAALQLLVEIADEQVVPFLVECFRFSRPHDGSAGHRRAIVLRGLATFAVVSNHTEALAIVEEALDHPAVRVRLAACRAIADVAGMSTTALPAPLATHLARVAHADRAPDIRVSARMALEAASHHPAAGA
jgi:hypothetical protein